MIGIDSPYAISKLFSQRVLLDTNVLIEAIHAPAAFEELIIGLEKAKCKPVIFPLVEFEIFRNIHQREIRDVQEKCLKAWGYQSLAVSQNLFEDALAFGNYYAARKISPSLTDCCIGALLKEHKDLLVLTRNHKDFPSPIFQRELAWMAEIPGNLLAFGFYRFNQNKKEEIEKYRSVSSQL